MSGPAGAIGTGTFTTITTPSQDLLLTFDPTVTNQFTVPVTFTAFGEQGDGVGVAESAAASGVTFDATIETPASL